MSYYVHSPGSSAARRQGCTCAVLDNNHGHRPPFPPDGWWISLNCPVHAAPAAERVADLDEEPEYDDDARR